MKYVAPGSQTGFVILLPRRQNLFQFEQIDHFRNAPDINNTVFENNLAAHIFNQSTFPTIFILRVVSWELGFAFCAAPTCVRDSSILAQVARSGEAKPQFRFSGSRRKGCGLPFFCCRALPARSESLLAKLKRHGRHVGETVYEHRDRPRG